jgi:arylsulfatase A-like enzyme/Tfp pilus assembly protein PilF
VARDVLLITVDTLRADTLGFAGDPHARTPTLDRLAARGTVFTSAHAHNVVTLPSHANILTGRLPFEHGIRDNAGFVLPESLPTAATLFREAGFTTAAVVGAFPLDARFGLDRGFDLYDDHYPEGSQGTGFRLVERRGDAVVERAGAWWREHAGERRFLWVHLFDPHAPYEPPEPWASRFRDDPYLGEIAATDAFLAPLLEPVLEDDSTLVVFTSDHGEALGDHGEKTHGLFAYEATLRVPLIVRSPGGTPGRTDAPARHIDILPTLLAGAGVAGPDDLPGRALQDTPGEPPEPVVTYFEALSANLNRGWAPLRGVLRDGDKLISLPLPELYDLESDPAEQTNRLENPGRGARGLARELSALLPDDGPVERHVSASADAEALRSLGYLSGSAARKDRYTAEDDPKNLVEVDRRIFRFIDLYQRGELEAATAAAREIVRDQPEMSAGYYHLAQVLLERGERREALETLDRAVERGATDGALLRQYGLLLAEAGRADEAVALLRPLRGTGDPENLNVLGLALSEAGHQARARAVLDEVFAHDPRNPTAHQHLALVALRSQAFRDAESQARRALELNRRLPLAWNYLGVALVNLGRPGEAIDAWEQALELQPDDFDVLYNVAFVAARTGDAERARPALRRFIAQAPPERYGPDLAKARALLSNLEGAQP